LQQLCNKRILLGVTSDIAAYEAAERVRELRKAKAGMDT
jgi:phosphopantothenoylcysteine decarboxylase/phosphopantothenate--cysteine ligase